MPSAAPFVPLALLFWIHMMAAVTWLGSLVAMASMVLPAAGRTLQPADRLSLIDNVRARLEPIIWISVSILIVTGLFQMSVNPHYNGFLSTSGQWSLAMLAKHTLVGALIAVSAVHSWDALPALRRALLQKSRLEPAEIRRLQRREANLLRASIILGVLVLLATAFARAS